MAVIRSVGSLSRPGRSRCVGSDDMADLHEASDELLDGARGDASAWDRGSDGTFDPLSAHGNGDDANAASNGQLADTLGSVMDQVRLVCESGRLRRTTRKVVASYVHVWWSEFRDPWACVVPNGEGLEGVDLFWGAPGCTREGMDGGK